jgi:amidase
LRNIAHSYRDRVMAEGGRTRLRAQWRELFNSFDAVICPIMPTPAYVQDLAPEQETRRIKIDGKDYPVSEIYGQVSAKVSIKPKVQVQS